MSSESPIKPAACAGYEALLRKTHAALTAWRNGREEIRRSGRRGRQADNELRTLQANFARSYTALQTHVHDCEVCLTPAQVHPGYGINPLADDRTLYYQ
jgi:hypothetical protein